MKGKKGKSAFNTIGPLS